MLRNLPTLVISHLPGSIFFLLIQNSDDDADHDCDGDVDGDDADEDADEDDVTMLSSNLCFCRQPTFLAPEISYFNYEPGATKVFMINHNDVDLIFVHLANKTHHSQMFPGLLCEAKRRPLPVEAGDSGELVLPLLLLGQQDLPGLGVEDISGLCPLDLSSS